LKARNIQTVMDVLSSIKLIEAPRMVKALTPEEQDVLMKYLYAGMAAPEQNNSGALLVWHEKVRGRKNANKELLADEMGQRKTTTQRTWRRNMITNKDQLFLVTDQMVLARK
jgi:hypothetical protein